MPVLYIRIAYPYITLYIHVYPYIITLYNPGILYACICLYMPVLHCIPLYGIGYRVVTAIYSTIDKKNYRLILCLHIDCIYMHKNMSDLVMDSGQIGSDMLNYSENCSLANS